VGNTQGAVVDKRGYAVVPYLTPYQLNAVALDPKGTDASVELKESSQNVAPRAGSVVRLKYEVDSSSLLLIDTQLSDGRPVPFGADVLDEDDNNVGLAGQAGRLMVRGVDDGATLTVRWGAGEQESCQMHVERLPEHGQMGDLVALQGSCIGPSDEASTSSAP
jgi:outer membrane usher protein